ncbi:23886_t:CDS:2, partial [Cetraspora pellucida]
MQKRLGFPDSSCLSFAIKIWVLLEGYLDPDKLKTNISQVTDLADFKHILKDEFELLKKVRPQNIVFLNNNNIPLLPNTCLQTLADSTTAKTPLIVHYPLSNANSKCKIPHTSGSLSLLREEVVKRFKELQTKEFYFFNDETKDEIRNEYSFNVLVSQTEPNGNDYNLKLKVKVEGKKSYSNWVLKDVFKEILGQPDYVSLEHPFSESELKIFIKELHTIFNAFHKEFSTNEPTAHLSIEIPLDGSRGYGSVDYIVEIGRILVLLCEANSEDMNKGTAQ